VIDEEVRLALARRAHEKTSRTLAEIGSTVREHGVWLSALTWQHVATPDSDSVWLHVWCCIWLPYGRIGGITSHLQVP
jgi:hypothetical protein